MSQPELRSVGRQSNCTTHILYVIPSGTDYLHYGAVLERLTGSQLVNKFPAFHGTRRFITAFTSDRHVFLFWLRIIYLNHRNVYSLS
jgi:hypothetical protein